MNDAPTVVINVRDLEIEDRIREVIEKRCQHLAEEFHETTRYEITLSEDGTGITAHAHVTGKSTEVATHAEAEEPGPAVDRMLDKVERQLRNGHDKRIFKERRKARREVPKRKTAD